MIIKCLDVKKCGSENTEICCFLLIKCIVFSIILLIYGVFLEVKVTAVSYLQSVTGSPSDTESMKWHLS